jgi:ribulose-phosphate 3-epimerase
MVARRKFGAMREIEARYNEELGEVELFEFKTVVEKVRDGKEISVDEARGLDPEVALGDSIGIKMDTTLLSRIAAQTAKQVIVHYEAFQDKSLILGSLAKINELGMKAGLAIKPNTSVDVVVQFKDLISQVTILSIEPGEQGREFLPESLEKIRQARLLLPEVQVEVDGGLNVDNIRAVVEAGADLLVVGSALVLSNNLQYSFDELTKAASFK